MTDEHTVGSIPSLLNHRIAAEEIYDIYAIVLGRSPESFAVVEEHVATGRTIAEFLQVVLDSPESRARQRELGRSDTGVDVSS